MNHKDDVFKNIEIRPDMPLAQFLGTLLTDFEKTGLNGATLDIPVTIDTKTMLLHFEISLQPANPIPPERIN